MRRMTRLVLLGRRACSRSWSWRRRAPAAAPAHRTPELAPEWQEVLTSKVSGKAPVKLNLGTHQLGTKVRLAWSLSGPTSRR